jgi:hypothetical protein
MTTPLPDPEVLSAVDALALDEPADKATLSRLLDGLQD